MAVTGCVNNIIIVASQELNLDSKFIQLVSKYNLSIAIQDNQNGTLGAIDCAFNQCDVGGKIVVALGDAPLITKNIVSSIMSSDNELCVAAFHSNKPENRYGKLVLDHNGNLIKIIEDKEANSSERKITLCNSGLMSCSKNLMHKFLSQNPIADGSTKEAYITDIVHFANYTGASISYNEFDEKYLSGANTKQELAALERIMQERLRGELMDCGVNMIAPDTVFLTPFTTIEKDVTIYPYVFLGKDVYIASGAQILSFSHIEGAKIEKNCIIGPFARIRPNTSIGSNSKIGNFVELKNTVIANNSKCSHLSYVGDASIGNNVNIGAGTIFCNYNGKEKYNSNVEDGVFIGSNSSIISPINIGKDSLIAAGTVVVKDVDKNSVAISRPELIVKNKRTQKQKNT